MATVNPVTSTSIRPGSWTTQPALTCFAVFALLVALAYALPFRIFFHWMMADELTWSVTDRDFANYWLGGRLVLSGEQQQMFTWDTYFPHMLRAFGEGYPIHNWSYPPHALLTLWPLGFLEYRPALVVFLGVSFVMFIVVVNLFRREHAAHVNPWVLSVGLISFVVMMVFTTQNGFLTASATLLGLAMMKRHPAFAGLAFAFLTIKPQLGLLIPVVLLFDRNWRAIAWSTAFTILLVGASMLWFGVESWHAYLTNTVHEQRWVMNTWGGLFMPMMPTTFGSVRTLGFPYYVANFVQLPVSLAAFGLVLWLLWRESDPLRRAFVVVCGTLLITPYALNYDMGALSAVAALLALSGSLAGRAEVLIMSVVATIAGAVTHIGVSGLPVTPLILTAGLLVVASHTWRKNRLLAVPDKLSASECAVGGVN